MMTLEYDGLRITYLEHDSFLIEWGDLKLYTDPFKLPKGLPKADVITITHEHFDHLSPDDLAKVATPETDIVASENCRGKIKVGKPRYLRAGEFTEVRGIKIEAVPAYNVNKFKSPGVTFHPRDYGGVGFLMTMGKTTIYHAGDTDRIPLMKQLRGRIDIALLPASGTYVMTPEEAADAALDIMPKIAIPMHWGAIVAGKEEAERFKRLLEGRIRVEVLEKKR